MLRVVTKTNRAHITKRFPSILVLLVARSPLVGGTAGELTACGAPLNDSRLSLIRWAGQIESNRNRSLLRAFSYITAGIR